MEEISLKELIQTLIKGKFIIIGITLAALALGALAFFITPNRYSATANILANPIVADIQGADAELNFPRMDMDSYMELFLNTNTMRQTIEALHLVDGNGETLSTNALASMVSLSSSPRTNILNVSVSHRDPELAAEIANELSRQFINHVTEIYQAIASTAANVLAERIIDAEISLDIAASNLREFLISSENIDLLSYEILHLTTLISTLRNELNVLSVNLEADTLNIVQLRELFQGASLNPDDITLTATITNRVAHTGTYNMQIDPTGDLGQIPLALRIADTEARIIEHTNRKNTIMANLDDFENHLQTLRASQAEEQFRYNDINRRHDIAETTLIMYVEQYNQALMIEASNLGNLNIRIVTEAEKPTYTYNRNLILFGGLSGVIGIFVGIFLVLFMHYWKTNEKVQVG